MRRIVILATCAVALQAEVAGTPVPPRPGSLPGAWFSWTNDALSGEIGDNTDDFRTSGFQLQIRTWENLLICLDHSTLTDKQHFTNPTARADEGTASVGWLFDGGEDRLDSPWIAPGVGVRFYGNLGGEAIQNAWHETIHIDEVDYLAYDHDDTVGLVYLAGGWALPLMWIPSTPFLQRGQVAIAVNGQSALTSDGLLQGSAEIQLAALGHDGGAWIGMRVSGDSGTEQGPTAETVSDHEAGWWTTYGVSVGGWFIAGAIEPDSKAATGRVGWQWQREPGRIDAGSRARMAGELTVLPGPSLGATLRWQPLWIRESNLGRHAWLTGTYRFGRTGVAWDDNVVVFDQATIGCELTGGPPGGGLHWEPYANASLGGRAERVVVRGDVPRYESERAMTGVATGAIGLRMVWGPEPAGERSARYGLGVGIEGWLPFQSASIDNGIQSDRYNEPGWTIGVSVSVLAQW